MENPLPDGVAQLDAEERAEREQELRAMLWDVRMGDDSASDGYEAGPGTSWALSEAAAVPGTPAPVGISPHSNPAMAVNESREQLLHPFPHRPAAAAASATPEISPGSYASSSSKANVVLEPLPAASLTPGLGPSGPGKQSYSEAEKEQPVEVKGAQADLASSSLLVALRGSCEPAELVSIMSQMAVTLRASEMERRHLKLQCCALRNEQARLNAQVQSLARRDRELEEHVLLLQAQLGDNAVSSPGTLPLLRGQMLEAARAEAERAKQEAEAAAAARERVEVEKEAEVRQAHQQLEALREEMGRLAGQVAQSAVLSSAQEREWRERQRRQEQELKHMDSLSRDVERLSQELDEARAARALEEQQHGATQRRLAEEEQATLSLNKKVEALEAEVAGAQARLREAQAEVVVLQRTLKAGEDEESGRLAGEMERMTQRFYEERRALEQRVEQLTAQLEARAGAVQEEEEEEPSSGCNMMRQFIEDGSEDGGDVESGVVHRYHREPPVERLLSPDGKSAVEAEVWRRVEAERSKMAEAFQEELRSVLAGARRAFEQERHSEMAELERELEGERARRERTRVLELEALRSRMEDERQVAVRAEADRLADELQARLLEARRCAEEELVGLLGRVEECLTQEPMGVAEGAGEGAVEEALASLLTKLTEWREAVRQQAAAERVQGSDGGKGEAVHVGVQTERQEGLEQGCQTDDTGVEELAEADEARWRELEAAKEAAAAEAVRALRQEMEGLRQAKEAEVARLSEELALLRSEASSAEGRWRAEAARHAAEVARLQEEADAARQAYEARISEVSGALRASKERCVALEESAAEASSVEEQVRALQARMDVEIERATKGHDEVVVRLEAQLQQARAEAAEAVGRAEEAERERRDVLGSAEREWRAKLEDIHAKMKLLQSALVKMGRRAASKDETVKQLRGELEEARRAEEVRRQVERERAEGLVKEADDKDRRVKELDKALHRARKEMAALQRQVEEQRVASDRDVEARLRREVEQLERRLSTRHEKELREALERARRESEQEVELVMTTMRRRYQRKMQKLQAQFEQDKEDLVLAAIVEARRTPRATKEKRDRDHHRGGRGQLTPPTPQVCLRTNFFDY